MGWSWASHTGRFAYRLGKASKDAKTSCFSRVSCNPTWSLMVWERRGWHLDLNNLEQRVPLTQGGRTLNNSSEKQTAAVWAVYFMPPPAKSPQIKASKIKLYQGSIPNGSNYSHFYRLHLVLLSFLLCGYKLPFTSGQETKLRGQVTLFLLETSSSISRLRIHFCPSSWLHVTSHLLPFHKRVSQWKKRRENQICWLPLHIVQIKRLGWKCISWKKKKSHSSCFCFHFHLSSFSTNPNSFELSWTCSSAFTCVHLPSFCLWSYGCTDIWPYLFHQKSCCLPN